MNAIVVSPSAFNNNGGLYQDLIDEIVILAQKIPVLCVSNHPEPNWFKTSFNSPNIIFREELGRQNGNIVTEAANLLGIDAHKIIVLAAKPEDIQMGKNGNALIVAAGWNHHPAVTSLGIKASSPNELSYIVSLISNWDGDWWYKGNGARYTVLALANLSGYGVTLEQQAFAKRLTSTVKQGGAKLNALLAVTCGSLIGVNVHKAMDLLWGVYPSSSSQNIDDEVLSDFTHRVRTTVSRVRLCKRGEPLFIRHQSSIKRSMSKGSVDRTDPSNQIETIHLNPSYRGKIEGRNVFVIDDCTTYGASFGVAASLLYAAGAASVTGVALGKFGNRLNEYNIEIYTDPFSPISTGGYSVLSVNNFNGSNNNASSTKLIDMI